MTALFNIIFSNVQRFQDWYYQRNNIKDKKNVHVPVAGQKKLLVPVAGLYIMLINGIIIIHLSEWIEFNFDWTLNTIKLSIRVNFC